MFYIRLTILCIWFIIGCIISFFMCLLRWGHADLDRAIGQVLYPALWMLGVKVEIENGDQLEAHQPCIYVANHQSGFDILTFGRICPHNVVVIGKQEILWVPFFGLVFKAGGNIMIKRQNRSRAIAGLNQAVDEIKRRKVAVIIFPEGTRNRSGEGLLPFKKGAFYMAIAAGIPVVPFICSPLPPLFSLRKRIFCRGTIRFRVLPPVPTTGLTPQDAEALGHRVREAMLESMKTLHTRAKVTASILLGACVIVFLPCQVDAAV